MPPAAHHTLTTSNPNAEERDLLCRAPIVLIGAGPQALALAAALLESQPYALDDAAWLSAKTHARHLANQQGPACKCGDIVVVDQAGEWMHGWCEAFGFLEIPTLRSPMLAHPDPRTELALLEACGGDAKAHPGADMTEWNAKVLRKDAGKRKKGKHHHHQHQQIKPFLEDRGFLYARPPTPDFERLCQGLVQRYHLADKVVAAKAVSLTRTQGDQVLVGLSDGSAIQAGRVVCCLGPNGGPRIPQWALPYRNRLADGPHILHSTELPRLGLASPASLYQGQHVLIVGGGLTSAHLVLSAHRHGAASVTLLTRGKIRVQEFCVDLKWVGRGRHLLLCDYRSQPVAERVQRLKAARPGGSITPPVMKQLRALLDQPRSNVVLHEGAEVAGISSSSSSSSFAVHLSNGLCLPQVDRLILATGSTVDISKDPLLSPLLGDQEVYHGLPVVGPSLRLEVPGVNIHVMGPYAALQVGPDAANLTGAMTASRLLADVIRGEEEEEEEAWGGGGVGNIHALNNPFDVLGEEEEEN